MTTIFISKMESLPPTSATKMIDIWLILCQLVPFAQVVLLTAMEFLREEKQEKKQNSEETEFLRAEPTKENLESNVQFEIKDVSKPKEAWTFAPAELSRANYVSMLAVIGRFLFGPQELFRLKYQKILTKYMFFQ